MASQDDNLVAGVALLQTPEHQLSKGETIGLPVRDEVPSGTIEKSWSKTSMNY